ncbi:Nicotianamine synthase [Fennellomyces sp. T-0311]|nr:Nicotianamine synthase [Fennellomyces sp. T-0311]
MTTEYYSSAGSNEFAVASATSTVTTTPMFSSATLSQLLVTEIKRLYQALATSSSLEPSDNINRLFTELVNLCITRRDRGMTRIVLKHPDIRTLIPHLRLLCATGEYLLELQWALKLVSDHDKYKLSDFTYYDNYRLLVRLELHALLGIGASIRHMVFIGSGPLPLSSIEMVRQASAVERIDNVDKSNEAIAASTALTQQLGLGEKLKYHCRDALDFNYGSADVVVLGALVGSDNHEKKQLLCHIIDQMKTGAILMVRSAHSLRELLYPSCKLEQPGLEPLVEIHPQNEVVNSVVLAQRI